MSRLRAAVALALGLASVARAQSFPARSGEMGILDVPDAEVTNLSGQIAAELRFDRANGMPDDYGPFPVYAVAGLLPVLDMGLTMRESGQPGDPRPQRLLFGGALKLRLWAPEGMFPGAALSATIDRANGRGVLGARLALSTGKGPLRFAAFGGAEAEDGGSIGVTAGGAVEMALAKRWSLAAEALTGPRGENFGAAFRYSLSRTMGVSVGGNWFPGEDGFRVAVTLAVSPAAKPAPGTPAVAKPGEPEAPVVAEAPEFLDDRPRFRLRIPTRGTQLGGPTRQHGPFLARATTVAEPSRPIETPAARAVAPSVDDLAAVQLRDQEALADARQKRVVAAGEQLDARESAAATEASRLGAREKELTSLEQQIALREARTSVRTPSQQQLQLEKIAAQFASAERNLAAQEKSYVPALDAAEGRERAAAVREQEEGAEVARLTGAVVPGMTRAAQIELRKQALAARSRKLAAMETRLLARGERIDATERQLKARAERVDAWMQRLNTRLERLELLEKLLEPSRTPPPPAPRAAPAEDKGAAAPPKDKPAFVMVVKAPTAVVKGGREASGGGGAAPAVSGEKSVIAATVMMFPTPATQMSELDRETLDNIARLAAKQEGELLVWARAKEPGLVKEAERRAAEIRARATTAGPLDPSRVNTRVTVRPGALGVDVVVSALKETAKPAEAASEGGESAATLLSGESGKRQIRDAVQAAQPSIEACVGDHIAAKGLQRAEGVLRLTISRQGRVTSVAASEGDLAGEQMDHCLGSASGGWRFPGADAEYVVDVPITVIRGEAAR